MESKRKHQTQLVKSYENLDPTAKIPSKISAGRVVIIPVSPDPSYISQSITEKFLRKEDFFKLILETKIQS